MRILLSLLALSLLVGCPKKGEHPVDRPDVTTPPPSTPPPAGDRHPAIAKDHPLYDRVEGTSFKNDCTSDADCVKGGCSSEVCSSEQVNTTCEFPEGGFPHGQACGCVAAECVWYQDGSQGGDLPQQGQACVDARCPAGLECVEYYGVAGPQGPKFTSCEIRCSEKAICPKGQRCVTIADGPGQVCRPESSGAIQ